MKNKPVVWIDSREKENSHVTEYFDSKPIDHFTSKLPYGDYMSLDNARVIVERKCGILEMVSTLGKDHERFKKELKEATKYGIHLIILIEEEGYDIVGTRRVTRKGEPPIRSFFARCFYKLINRMSNVEMVDGARDYRLMTRQVVDSILELKEYNRYSKGLFSFVGYKTKWLEYENIERVAGETKWSFWKLFKYAIEGIVAFTTVPLTMITFAGVIFSLSAFVMLIIIIVKAIKGAVITNLLALLTALFGVAGITLLCLGVVAFYLAKAYLEIKDRPIYIIKETNME